jgi:hypothetical protein
MSALPVIVIVAMSTLVVMAAIAAVMAFAKARS